MAASPVPEPSLTPKPQHPLRERNFRLLLTGSTISLLGDQCYIVALPWLVLQMTGSAVAMGTILMAAAIPRAILMLLGGAVSDRMSPRKIMIMTASTRTLFVAAIGVLVWLKMLRMWELYGLAFAFGVADAFALPAMSAYMPSLVKREQLLAGNSTLQSAVQLTMIAGPAPAGLLIKALGMAWAFFLDAISFLFIIAALWALPDPPASHRGPRKAVWHSILEGIQFVARDVQMRSLILLATVINFCITGPVGVGLAYLAKIRFGSPAAYGTTLSALAVGALLGTLSAGMIKVRRRGFILPAVGVIIGLCMGPMGLMWRLWEVAVLMFLIGITAGLSNVHIISWLQQRIDPSIRGRIMSVMMTANVGLMPVSLALAGVLVAWSLEWTFLIAGTAMLFVSVLAVFQKAVREIE
ncbi:MAG TPA: MFS transporter [Candidatus Angelobacter sp.]|nr:MFS transporter [Candidatus Angelobacter sp.]